MPKQAQLVVAVAMALIAVGCGGADGHPDTGAGARQTVPATENCADLCRRLGNCTMILCNEDTKSTRFDGIADVLQASCVNMCTDAIVMSISPVEWTCFFESSCRQIFEFHHCDKDSYYRCS